MGRAVLQYSHCISDTTRRRWSGRAGMGAQAEALGAGRHWSQTGAGARQARGALQGRVGHAAGARGLGVLLGCGLCTWSTQPFFDPV